VTEANPTDKTISLPSFFACRRRGLGGEHDKKLKGNGFGRAVAHEWRRVRWRVSGSSLELPQGFPSVRFRFEPPRGLCVTNCVRHSQSTPRSKKVRVLVRISAELLHEARTHFEQND